MNINIIIIDPKNLNSKYKNGSLCHGFTLNEAFEMGKEFFLEGLNVQFQHDKTGNCVTIYITEVNFDVVVK